jgi:hypothetical protein
MGVKGLLSLAETRTLHLLLQDIELLLYLPQRNAGGRSEPALVMRLPVVAHRVLRRVADGIRDDLPCLTHPPSTRLRTHEPKPGQDALRLHGRE